MAIRQTLIRSESGAALVEYPLIASAIAACVFLVLLSTAGKMNDVFTSAGNQSGLSPSSGSGGGSGGDGGDPGGPGGPGDPGGPDDGGGGGKGGGELPIDGGGDGLDNINGFLIPVKT